MENTIYEYITVQEESFRSVPIDLMGWEWSMYEHIKKAFYYKHGRLLTGNDANKPVKNIVKPILNLQYRTEDIDVKDIFLYVDNPDYYHLSFLVKKYHDEVFVREYDLDTLWDKVNESRVDYGGGLLKNINAPVPEIVPLPTIAFCDQTDMLAGPIGIKHYFSPDQLLEMGKFGWGKEEKGATISLEDLIMLGESHKESRDKTQMNKTPGKFIEVYEVHGNLPERYLEDTDSGKYVNQMQIVAFYATEGGMQAGVTLFKGKSEPLSENFRLITRDEVDGRALGFGGVEELEESQVWTNYNQIRFKELLDAAAKTILQTDDPAFAARNKISNMKNLEIAVLDEGKTIRQVDTFPRNIDLFTRYTQEWEVHAQQMGAANDSIMGKNPASGTPFKLQELVTQESMGLHDYRRGKYAKFIEIIYRDWIIPHIIKQILKGHKFLAELSFDEMQEVSQAVVRNQINRRKTDMILNGKVFTQEEMEAYEMLLREEFGQSNKKFIDILKDEFKGMEINIAINIAGKQKALASHVDKLVNVFRQVASAPQLLEDPRLSKLFNQILEASGLSPIDFGTFKLSGPAPQVAAAQTVPIAEQGQTINE